MVAGHLEVAVVGECVIEALRVAEEHNVEGSEFWGRHVAVVFSPFLQESFPKETPKSCHCCVYVFKLQLTFEKWIIDSLNFSILLLDAVLVTCSKKSVFLLFSKGGLTWGCGSADRPPHQSPPQLKRQS